MSRVFITGDRSMSIIYPGLVLLELLRQNVAGNQVMTGDFSGGVEDLVRYFATQTELDITVVPGSDLDARHLGLPDDTQVVIIHADPLSSRVTRSVIACVPEDRVVMRTPADLLQ